MTQDRLQAAWRYVNAELWRPLFKRFEQFHPDLPIAVARSMLVRPTMRPLFVATGVYPALDNLRADVATYLDLPNDARSAISRIKPLFFVDGRSVAVLFADVAVAFEEYENPDLDQFYRARLAHFIDRHALPYRLDLAPLKLTPLLPGEVDAMYRNLRARAALDPGMQEALSAFESSWERQSTDWTQITAKEAIRAASLLAENMVVSASNGQENEFSAALSRMRNGNRFPSNEFANIFARAYTFANTYPNIRHPGNPECRRRDLRREDATLAALVFVGLSACAHDLCVDET